MRNKRMLIVYILVVMVVMSSCTKGNTNSSSQQTSLDISSDTSSNISSNISSEKQSSSTSSLISSEETPSSKQQASSEEQTTDKPQTPNVSKPVYSSKITSSIKDSSNSFSWDKGGTYTGSININISSSPKTTVLGDGNTMIDTSNIADGYITASHQGSTQRLKLQITKDQKTYNYDLNNNGVEEVFPLQMGNGDYKFRVMENVTGNQYVQLFTETINVQLNSYFSPFLYPNQFVNYNQVSKAVKKSYDLCLNAKSDLDKVKSIYNYIIETIDYDYAKAKSVKSGYLPNVDSTLSTKTGICFDYAALMAAMLRAQNIPTKLVVGNVAPNDISHAWNDVYIKNKGWITIGLKSDGSQWTRLDSTFGASQQAEIEKFIGNGSNYTVVRIY